MKRNPLSFVKSACRTFCLNFKTNLTTLINAVLYSLCRTHTDSTSNRLSSKLRCRTIPTCCSCSLVTCPARPRAAAPTQTLSNPAITPSSPVTRAPRSDNFCVDLLFIFHCLLTEPVLRQASTCYFIFSSRY